MRAKKTLFGFFITFLLIACTNSSAPTPISAIPVTASSPFPTVFSSALPSNIQTSVPTVAPTSTTDPKLQYYLNGVEEILPKGAEPLYSQAWIRGQVGKLYSSSYLPYHMDGGLSLLVVGQPRQEDGNWNGEDQIRIWDWQDTGLKPTTWQEILPLDFGDGRGLSSFLGRDDNGQWWAVMSRIDSETLELIMFGVFPFLLHDSVQIEPVALDPSEKSPEDVTHYLVRTNEQLMLYKLEENQAIRLWSTDQVMQGLFHVHSYAQPGGSVDMTNDGNQEILVVWDFQIPHLIDAYQVTPEGSEVLHWLGRLDSRLQYTDVTGDGVADLLQADNAENPREWQVIAWDGNIFKPTDTISWPEPVTPSPVRITNLEDLPPLPSPLILQNNASQAWWRWPQSGGPPEEISVAPGDLYGDCAPYDFGGYGDACYSPAGRYKLVDMPVGIEGSDVGISDGFTGNEVHILESFVYSMGFNTFAWSRDETFLLHARGEGVAKLNQVNPVTGESVTIWNYNLCGLDRLDCYRYDGEALTDPVVFADYSIGFAVQSGNPAPYPPPGIYRLSPDGKLTSLVSLPFIDASKGSFENLHPSTLIYGHLLWSPDKSTFLFYDLFVGNKTGVRTLLLGKADGSALWDLRDALPNAREFRWE